MFGGGAGGIGAGGFGIRFALGKVVGLVGEVALFVGECMGLGGGLAGNILLGVVVGGRRDQWHLCAAWAACVSWLAAWESCCWAVSPFPWRMEFFTASAVLAAAWAWALAAGFVAQLLGLFFDVVGELGGFLIGRFGRAVEFGFVLPVDILWPGCRA